MTAILSEAKELKLKSKIWFKMRYLTTTEAAEILNLSTRRIIALVRYGVLTGQKHGRDWMISEDSVKARAKETPGAGRPKKN